MAVCEYPLTAWQRAPGVKLVFAKPTAYPAVKLEIPCGRCIPCRLTKSGEKATRMMHELRYHDSAYMVNLTYNDAHLPPGGVLVKAHVQLFMKKVRHLMAPVKVRSVNTGEYGERDGRPHYHLIIYGLALDDLVAHRKNDRGDMMYTSATLENLWGRGFVVIGSVTRESCRYVASYALKDTAAGPGNRSHYERLDEVTGELRPVPAPFTTYSNRPGIGAAWVDEFGHTDAFPHDNIIVEGKPIPIPGYYMNLLKRRDPARHDEIKAKRVRQARAPHVRANNTPERRKVRAACLVARLKLKPRGTRR